MSSVDWEWEDVRGCRVTVETLTSAVARLTVYDDADEPMKVAELLITPEAAQALAEAVRHAVTDPA